MSTASVSNVIRYSGRLVHTPTDLTTAFPYGGTALGVNARINFRFGQRVETVKAEEWGGHSVAYYYTGEGAVLSAILRDWDSDALAKAFPNTFTGADTSEAGIRCHYFGSDADERPGDAISGFPLLVAPNEEESYPFIFIYEAIPLLQATAEMQLSLGQEFGLGVAFHAVPNTNGKVYEIAKRRDISITQ